MANVDLVDLVPILKAIYSIKNEYKEALQTSETDFSLYPVLTENFIDESYNQGYEIGYKQAWMDYLGTTEVDVLLPREMRELVPATYTSQSGDATYDTLTSIMNFCLQVRRNLKTILDLDSDLFELYPPRLIEVAGSQYVAGTNDGYVQGVTAISSLSITAPKIEQINNSVVIHTQFPGATTYYTVGTGGEFIPYVDGTEIPVPEDSTIVVYAYSNAGTKNSEVVSDEFTYTSFLQPTITFEDNIVMIYSNYSLDENVTTMYKLSSWEDYQEFIEYDGIPIPINSTTLVEAYNVFEDGSTSSTTQRVCTPVDVPVAETPLTPVVTFSDSTNILTITCSTNGAIIYYKKEGSSLGWIQYTSPIKLVESGTYSAISVLNGVESAPSEPVVCTVSSGGGTGIILPPTIICNNNKVTVFTSQSGVTLKVIRLDYGYVDSANDIPFDSWVTYDGPFDISQDGKYQAKAILNSDTTKEALSVECQCKYYSTPSGSGSTSGGGEGSTDIPYVAPPIIYYTNHVVSMTAVTAGSSIKYKTAWEDTWHDYTTPITITESAVFQAKAVKDGNESTVTELACKVEDEGIWMCYMDFSYDTLTVTTNVSGGNILVKRANDTWEEYSGPISITQSDWWYAKVEREGLESEVFSLWCEYSNTDYSTLQFTIVLEQDGYIKIHSIGSGTQPNYDTSYFAYLNGFGRWSQLRYGMFWKANTPLLIEASIPASKSNGRRYTIRTGVNYVVYGNAATLIRESDRENLPSNVVLTLGEECTSHAGLSLPETWSLDVEHNYAPSAPTIVFDSNTNTVIVNKASDSPDSFLQYKIDDDGWYNYTTPITIHQNCTFYARAFYNLYSISKYSSEVSETISDIPYVNPVESPSISFDSSTNTVTITSNVNDAIIYYYFEETETSDNLKTYSSPFTISSSCTVVAKVQELGVGWSEETSLYCTYVAPPVENFWFTGAQYFTWIDEPTLRDYVNDFNYSTDVPQYRIKRGENYITSWITMPVEPIVETQMTDKIEVRANPNMNTTVNLLDYYDYMWFWIRAVATENLTTGGDISSLNGLFIPHTSAIPMAWISFNAYTNTVSISCETEGAVIKYRISGSSNRTIYSNPFVISSSATYEAIAENNGETSDISARYCEYTQIHVETPVLSFNDETNTLTATCSTNGATIQLSTDSGSTWTNYTEPITVSTVTTYIARATKSGSYSDISESITCTPYTCTLNAPSITYITWNTGRPGMWSGKFSKNNNTGILYYAGQVDYNNNSWNRVLYPNATEIGFNNNTYYYAKVVDVFNYRRSPTIRFIYNGSSLIVTTLE